MFGLSIIDIIAIVGYFVVVIAIGIWSSRRISSQEDFFLGGRRFGKFVQTFAAFGQATSSDNAVGLTVGVARNGVSGIWSALTSVFTLPVYWITSVWYRRMRLLTMGDFFEERYGSKNMAAFYSIVSSVFFMVIIALGFVAMTRTIAAVTDKPISAFADVQKAEYQKAVELEKLENRDVSTLNSEQLSRLEQLRYERPSKSFSYINENWLIWIVAFIVVAYSVAGGLEAAFLTDTLQGIFILILSFLLLPFACIEINSTFGGSGITGIIDTVRERVSQGYFDIWGGATSMDFTWYSIIVLMFVNVINVGVQANQLTACGSAKDEQTARVGFTSGIFMKRAALLLWGITAFLIFVLYQDKVSKPDFLWGYASKELLGRLNIGLVGLMIASLMAALMSTADALMITASSLLTHNCLRYYHPNLSEKSYVQWGRGLGVVVVFIGAFIATQFDNIFFLMKLIWEFNIILAAAFWLGMKWRRANRRSAWASMITTFAIFTVLPLVIPLVPGVKTSEHWLKKSYAQVIEKTYTARAMDVEQSIKDLNMSKPFDSQGLASGESPAALVLGQQYTKTILTKSESIFWTDSIKYVDDAPCGSGRFNIDLALIDMLGFDLSQTSYAFNESIRFTIRTIFPFLVLIIVSFFTKPDDKQRLDLFFVKMKTPVIGSREDDEKQMQLSYADTSRFDYKKLFPSSQWEFERPLFSDVRGAVLWTISGVVLLVILYFIVRLCK